MHCMLIGCRTEQPVPDDRDLTPFDSDDDLEDSVDLRDVSSDYEVDIDELELDDDHSDAQ
jgi:hypothetical protein